MNLSLNLLQVTIDSLLHPSLSLSSCSPLKTLIPHVTLLSQSITNEELDRYVNDTVDHLSNNVKRETNISKDSLSNEPMTIGDLVDQNQQRARIVVLDRVVCLINIFLREKQN